VFCAFLYSSVAFAATKTWTGGAGTTNFNTSTNWSPSTIPGSTDDIVISLTAAKTVQLSASVTINSLSMTYNQAGGSSSTLNLNDFVLTINTTATFDAGSASTTLYVNTYGSTGKLLVLGATVFSNGGSGIVVIESTGGAGKGIFDFQGNVTFGPNCNTSPGTEVIMTFDGATTQAINCNQTSAVGSGFVASNDMNFGNLSNFPTVTISGVGSYTFFPYDGNCRIFGTTYVKAGTCTLDRDKGDLIGTFTMDAGSRLDIGNTNGIPGYNMRRGANDWYGTYSISPTSTIDFNGSGTTQNITAQNIHAAIILGNIIIDGTGSKTQATSGGLSVTNDLTIVAGATYSSNNNNITVAGNVLINGTYQAGTGNNTFGGNYTNNSVFTQSTSNATFNGTAAQAIGGTASTTFYNLIINNTSALTVGVRQNINTQISNVMTLTKGAYGLNTYTLTLQSALATAISAGSANTAFVVSETQVASNTSYIDWQVGATNATYVFPFGVPATGNYIPFTFVKTAGTTTDLYVSTRGTAASDNLPFPGASDAGTVGAVTNLNGFAAGAAVNYAVTNVIDRWWDIYAPGGATANVTFSYQGIENATTTGTIQAQHWSQNTTPDWDPPVGAGTGSISGGVGTCTVTGATTFSPWVLISNGVSLPVEFMALSTVCSGSDATEVKWSTATETNNKYFTVERSSDGISFLEMGRKAGAGTSSSVHSYIFQDKYPALPSYYRIKQTDFDGISKYSDVMFANCASPSLKFIVYPNPGVYGEPTYIRFPDLKKGTNLIVSAYNMTGKLVYSKNQLTGENAETVVSIDPTEKTPAGIYLIQIVSDTKAFYSKLVIR
jgi:hypothetical protein